MTVGDAASMIHPISGEGVGYAIESGRLVAAWAHEAHSRGDFSTRVFSGYEKQLRRQRAREQFSGLAFVKLIPKMEVLEPLFKASEKDPAARRTMVEIFTGDTPIYGLLKHPKAALPPCGMPRERSQAPVYDVRLASEDSDGQDELGE